MKNLVYLLSSLLLAALLATPAQAQLLKRLKNKAKDAVQDRVEEKIDQKIRQIAYKSVDRTWESVFGESSEDLEDGAAPPDLPYTLNADVDTEEVYTFSKESVMEIIHVSGEEQEKMWMTMYMSNKGDYSATTFKGDGIEEDQEPTMIYDYGNSAMIMLMDSEEGPFSFAYEWAREDVNDEYEEGGASMDNPYSDLESLGTKTILGYECEGYRSETDQSVTDYWISNEKVEGLEQVMHANSNTRFLSVGAMNRGGNGTLMESVSTDKQSGERTEMRMTQLSKEVSKSFTMEEYPLIGSR